MQASSNTIPNDPMTVQYHAESRGAHLGYEYVGAPNAVEACANRNVGGAKGNNWAEVWEGENGERNMFKTAGDGDVQMADDHDVIVLD